MSCRLFVFNGLCLVSYVIWLELDTLAWTISVDFVSFAFFTGEAAKIYFQYSNENGSAFAVEKCDKNNHNQKLISGGSLKIYSENGKSETDMTSFKQGTSITVFESPSRWLSEARQTLSLYFLFMPPSKTYDTSYSLSFFAMKMKRTRLIMKLIY